MKAWGLGSGRFRNPAPGAASRVTTAHERRVTGRYHSPPAWRVADRGATTCQLPGFPHDHTSVGRALGATELGLLGAGAVQLCALERRGVGVHYIRFLKQIVLERISFQTRGLGTWASAPSTSKMDCWGPGSGQSSRLSELSEGRAMAEKMERLWEVWGGR